MFERGKMYLVIRNRKKTIGQFFIPGSFFLRFVFLDLRKGGLFKNRMSFSGQITLHMLSI